MPSDFSFLHIDRPMRFEIEVTLAGKRFKYAIAFDWPDTFREARIIDESLAACRWSSHLHARLRAGVQLPGGGNFGLDWHVFALPVINGKRPARPGSSGSQGISRVDRADCTHSGRNVGFL